jgi:hypothetical protein
MIVPLHVHYDWLICSKIGDSRMTHIILSPSYNPSATCDVCMSACVYDNVCSRLRNLAGALISRTYKKGEVIIKQVITPHPPVIHSLLVYAAYVWYNRPIYNRVNHLLHSS